MSKTTSITVERNYRIDNSDPYLKARLSHSVELDENDIMEDAALGAIKLLDNVFRMAYPHVEEHLNFYVVRQVNGNFNPMECASNKMMDAFINNPIVHTYPNETVAKENEPTTGKGTIEDQIQACKTMDELITFELMAKMNPKLKAIYDKKFIGLKFPPINKTKETV